MKYCFKRNNACNNNHAIFNYLINRFFLTIVSFLFTAYEYLKNAYLILFFHVFPELFINRNEYGMQNRQSSYTTTTFTRLRARIDSSTILNICCYENFTTLGTPKNCFSSEHDIRRNWSDYFGSLFSMNKGVIAF
jgi:hypothetical protein